MTGESATLRERLERIMPMSVHDATGAELEWWGLAEDAIVENEQLRKVAAKCAYFLRDGSMTLNSHVAIWMRELLEAAGAQATQPDHG